MFKVDIRKKYMTLEQRPVRILCVDAPGDCPVVGYMCVDDGSFPGSWTADGKWLTASDQPSEYDLVEVPEKRRMDGWVNVYEDGTGANRFPTKEAADSFTKYCFRKRIACVDLSQFECTVGEGLE